MNFHELGFNFLTKCFDELIAKNFHIEKYWNIDHLCYRTSTEEQYNKIKTLLGQNSVLLIESEVNGRLISTFKLDQAIAFQNWYIDLIEVPAPKKGKLTNDGFEHFEIVSDLPMAELKEKYSKFQMNEMGLSKSINPELEFQFNNFAIKFHPISLASVINIESNVSLFKAIKESDIFNILKEMDPVIVGTFPLNLNISNSDIDILISSSDLNFTKEIFIKFFSRHLNFSLNTHIIDKEIALILNFEFQNFKFEIVAQHKPIVKQTAFRHFILEERILKLSNKNYIKKLQELRSQGLKTEPAFAKLLNLEGDPYQAILNLNSKSDIELFSLVNR